MAAYSWFVYFESYMNNERNNSGTFYRENILVGSFSTFVLASLASVHRQSRDLKHNSLAVTFLH